VLSSALVLVWIFLNFVVRMRQLRAHRQLQSRANALASGAAIAAMIIHAGNVILWGSVAAYAAALMFQLAVAAVSFYSLVSDRARSREGDA
jgi:hypothetical protein